MTNKNEIVDKEKASRPRWIQGYPSFELFLICHQLFKTRMYVTKLSDEKYHVRYNLTNKQKAILNALGTNEEEYKEFIEVMKSTLN